MEKDAVGPLALSALVRLVAGTLRAAGATEEEARIVADHVVDAEARGKTSQGLVRVARYAGWARDGTIVSPTELRIEREAGSTLVVDARRGWGHVAALRTMELCVERAQTHGLCLALIRDTNHIGRLGYYVEAAARREMIGLILCSGNPDFGWVAPWGGVEPLFGTNPLALGFPRTDGPPVVVDISTTQTARGNVLMARKLGTELPEGWAFDERGRPTRDPESALPPHGTLAPLGGHKGYALALAVEILCGVLAGLWPPTPSANLVGALRIEAFLPPDTYRASLQALAERVRGGPTRPGFDEIRLPGEESARRRAASETDGLTISPEIWEEIRSVAQELGVDDELLA